MLYASIVPVAQEFDATLIHVEGGEYLWSCTQRQLTETAAMEAIYEWAKQRGVKKEDVMWRLNDEESLSPRKVSDCCDAEIDYAHRGDEDWDESKEICGRCGKDCKEVEVHS